MRRSLVAIILTLSVYLSGGEIANAQVAVLGKKVHTMAGPPIENGVVLIRDGKVDMVGKADAVSIPDGFRVLRAEVVTPGLIDAHSAVGLTGIFNHPHDQDQLERSAPIQPELRAIDAYNAREQLVAWVRASESDRTRAMPGNSFPDRRRS
jgi:imidazolonepropionase-like amidohydrolase